MNKCILLFFTAFPGFWMKCTAQSSENTGKLLRQYLTVQEKRIGFNGVVLIGENENVLHRESIGKASFELGIPLTEGSVFRVASVTKSFTALLMVLAAQEGKLDLNDSLGKFFPELKEPQWRRITVAELLSHRSGIPHNEGIADYWSHKSLLPLNEGQALTEIFGTKLLFEPGSAYKYSSPGYFLLAIILEKLYHQNFAAILREKITFPLGMNGTGVYHTQAVIPGMTSSYHLAKDSVLVAPYRDFSLMKGSGDLYSNPFDLLKWTNSFAGIQWNDELKAQIFKSPSHDSLQNNEDAYGYGWFIRPRTDEVKAAFYHGGGTYGCSAICVWYPESKISVIILSNLSVLPVNELWGDIEKIIFNHPFTLPVVEERVNMDHAQLPKLEGIYVSEQGKLSIRAEKGQLYAKLGGNPAFEIYGLSPSGFYGKKVNAKFNFQSDQEGRVTGVTVESRGQIHTFSKE